VAATLPTSLITRLARQQAQTVDFATSNVRGAPMPLYMAGAQLLENYPVGPLGGVAFNLTLLSYNHSLDMGVNIDTGGRDRTDAAARLPGARVQGPAGRLTAAAAARRRQADGPVDLLRAAAACAGIVSSVRTSSSTSVISPEDTSSRLIICESALSITLKASWMTASVVSVPVWVTVLLLTDWRVTNVSRAQHFC
jgi:hypothetical protein